MARTDLTPSEGAVIGHPGDLVDEDRVPARPKSSTVMFSLRVDRQTFEALSDIAEERGRRFSDVARDALHVYVDRPTDAASYRLLEAIAAKVGVQTAERDAVCIRGIATEDRRPKTQPHQGRESLEDDVSDQGRLPLSADPE